MCMPVQWHRVWLTVFHTLQAKLWGFIFVSSIVSLTSSKVPPLLYSLLWNWCLWDFRLSPRSCESAHEPERCGITHLVVKLQWSLQGRNRGRPERKTACSSWGGQFTGSDIWGKTCKKQKAAVWGIKAVVKASMHGKGWHIGWLWSCGFHKCKHPGSHWGRGQWLWSHLTWRLLGTWWSFLKKRSRDHNN